MFCSVKKSKGDKWQSVKYRFYLCERKRINGKVKCFDKYITKLDGWWIAEAKATTVGHCIEFDLREKGFIGEDLKDAKELILSKILDVRDDIIKIKEKEEAIQREKENKEQEEFYNKYKEYYQGYSNKSSGISSVHINNTTKEFIQKIIKSGYKKLASQHHPDRGGRLEDMQRLNEAKEQLDKIIEGI